MHRRLDGRVASRRDRPVLSRDARELIVTTRPADGRRARRRLRPRRAGKRGSAAHWRSARGCAGTPRRPDAMKPGGGAASATQGWHGRSRIDGRQTVIVGRDAGTYSPVFAAAAAGSACRRRFFRAGLPDPHPPRWWRSRCGTGAVLLGYRSRRHTTPATDNGQARSMSTAASASRPY